MINILNLYSTLSKHRIFFLIVAHYDVPFCCSYYWEGFSETAMSFVFFEQPCLSKTCNTKALELLL